MIATFARQWALWIVGLLILTLPPLHQAVKKRPVPDAPERDRNGPVASRLELKQLSSALRQGDDSAILNFFRSRVLTSRERARIQSLVDQLGADSFSVRSKATAELEAIGPRAAGILHRALSHPDLELVVRSRQLLSQFVSTPDVLLISTAVRHLGQTRPLQATAVLLDYLPDVEDSRIADEVRSALLLLTFRDGKPDPALLAALADPQPEKRAAAGVALCQPGGEEHRPAIRKLLDDDDAGVRHRVALALLPLREKEALRVLIDLLPVLPVLPARAAWTALDLLYQAAGVDGPAVPLGDDPAGRQRCRDEWQKWWTAHGTKIERLDLRIPGAGQSRGPTLLVAMEPNGSTGQVLEVGKDGKPLWHISNLDYPVWAEWLSPERLLIVEHQVGRPPAGRISERDVAGALHWSIQTPVPVLYAQRLAGGSTFVAGRNALWEVDRGGNRIVLVDWPWRSIVAARRLPDGRIVILTDEGECVLLDQNGKEIRRFETGCKGLLAPGIDVTPNGRVLVPDYSGNRVLEFSPSGELLWQATALRPTSVQRLLDGSTLVAVTWPRQVFERGQLVSVVDRVVDLDRLGQVLWRYSASSGLVVATRR